MPSPTTRPLRDLGWAAVGLGGAVAGMRAVEALRPPVIAGEPGDDPFRRELPRAYAVSAVAVLASPFLGAAAVRVPRVSGLLGLGVEVAGVGLRVRAMRELHGHYARTVRVVDERVLVRTGPYRYVRHPGYLGGLPDLSRRGPRRPQRHRPGPDRRGRRHGLPAPHGRRGRAPVAGPPGVRRLRRDDPPPGALDAVEAPSRGMSLDEVRAAIDRIDDQIIALLAQRQAQVEEAATYKADDAAVRAPDRRAALLARVRDRAVEEGVHPDVVAATYTAMVDAFIALELGERRSRGS